MPRRERPRAFRSLHKAVFKCYMYIKDNAKIKIRVKGRSRYHLPKYFFNVVSNITSQLHIVSELTSK
jgi:hypothetical protein